MKYIHIHPLDNVAVALEDLKKGDLISVTAKAPAEIQSSEAPAGLPSAAPSPSPAPARRTGNESIRQLPTEWVPIPPGSAEAPNPWKPPAPGVPGCPAVSGPSDEERGASKRCPSGERR